VVRLYCQRMTVDADSNKTHAELSRSACESVEAFVSMRRVQLGIDSRILAGCVRQVRLFDNRLSAIVTGSKHRRSRSRRIATAPWAEQDSVLRRMQSSAT
jgi:hypothetical protein